MIEYWSATEDSEQKTKVLNYWLSKVDAKLNTVVSRFKKMYCIEKMTESNCMVMKAMGIECMDSCWADFNKTYTPNEI